MYYSLVRSKESIEIDFHRTEEQMQELIQREGWVPNKPCKYPKEKQTIRFKDQHGNIRESIIEPKTYTFIAESDINEWCRKVNTIMCN